MTEELKTPEAGEYWISDDGSLIRIVGVKLNGGVIYENQAGFSFQFNSMTNWRHEPRCTGFDWTEPPAIDPGEGWELLPVGTVLRDGDEYLDSFGVWIETQQADACVGDTTMKTYRRKIKPVETWPKYYRGDNWCSIDAYVRFDDEYHEAIWVAADGTERVFHGERFHTIPERIEENSWREVTEAEALARVVVHPDDIPLESSSEARQLAAHCWCDKETENTEMDVVLAEAVARRIDLWMGIAKHHCRNEDFYRGLLDKCANNLGPLREQSYITDDGGIHDEPLRLKIPGLVAELVAMATALPPVQVESPDDWVEPPAESRTLSAAEYNAMLKKLADQNPPPQSWYDGTPEFCVMCGVHSVVPGIGATLINVCWSIADLRPLRYSMVIQIAAPTVI